MKIASGRGRILYETAFQRPYFDIAANGVNTMTVLQARLSQLTPVTLANFSVSSGPPLTDTSYSVALYDGGVQVRLFLDHLRIEVPLNWPLRETDVDVITNVINTLLEALPSIAEGFETRSTNIQVAQWYRTDQSASEVFAWLKEHAHGGADDKLRDLLAAEVMDFSPTAQVQNMTERWSARFMAELASVKPFQLFVSYQGTYVDGGKYQSLEQRRAHIGDLYAKLFEYWGLDLVEELPQ